MHGSIQQMVCPHEGCHAVVDMDDSLMKQLLRREDIPCRSCPCPSIRCRIMLYDDKEGISPHSAAVLKPDALHGPLNAFTAVISVPALLSPPFPSECPNLDTLPLPISHIGLLCCQIRHCTQHALICPVQHNVHQGLRINPTKCIYGGSEETSRPPPLPPPISSITCNTNICIT